MCERCSELVAEAKVMIEMAEAGIGEYTDWSQEDRDVFCTDMRQILVKHAEATHLAQMV